MIIFVFGSNLPGKHGRGAARFAAMHYGAVYGVGEGRTGDAYALPTKDHRLVPRSLQEIQISVERFLAYAAAHPELSFKVTRVGCGLAGYADEQIAPMFANASPNCRFDPLWTQFGFEAWQQDTV